jgi:ribonuclease P protein component
MLHTDSITENKDFRRLYYRGKAISSPLVVLYSMPNRALRQRNQLGITVSKKVGKAVFRNKVRRWIKEAYRSYEPKMKTGFSMVILARQAVATEGDYWKIQRQLGGLFKKAGIFALEDK